LGEARFGSLTERDFVTMNTLQRDELGTVSALSLQAKKAYCAKTRRANYVASLRLEGYEITLAESQRELPIREAILNAYRKQS